ncbi:MAG: hypothetical protein R8K47_06445, partial [Mariprofundaceae bacterium]
VIGILAAIAIPQFQKYRIKSLDTASVSDIRHLAVFESQFFNEYNTYVGLTPADKDATGHIVKTVTVPDGGTQTFRVDVLTKDIQILANIDAKGQNANVGAYNPGGAHIVALEVGAPGVVYAKPFFGTLTNADVPAATDANDFTSWQRWQK